MNNILITGGAGFVGASLARRFKGAFPDARVVAFDNLHRKGSELNAEGFQNEGIEFHKGDVRFYKELQGVNGDFDLVIDASAEPSVHAGAAGEEQDYVIQTNLNGTIHCLQFAVERSAAVIFLSTSRVYAIPDLRSIPLIDSDTRLSPDVSQLPPGMSKEGITEDFATARSGGRSIYGTTKLASELFAEEFAASANVPCVVNRCGVIAGPGQFGKTDQGVFTLWVARHFYGGDLQYTGFGGQGHQVRDILHPDDLFELLLKQCSQMDSLRGEVFSIGGGMEGSVSLAEYTELCATVTAKKIKIAENPETAAVDIPWYVTDYSLAKKTFNWQPQVRPAQIVEQISRWLENGGDLTKRLFS